MELNNNSSKVVYNRVHKPIYENKEYLRFDLQTTVLHGLANCAINFDLEKLNIVQCEFEHNVYQKVTVHTKFSHLLFHWIDKNNFFCK